MKKYEIIEHTADIGVIVQGKNLTDLFNNAGQALFSLILGEIHYSNYKDKELTLDLEAPREDDLLVSWLNELISLFFSQSFLAVKFQLEITDNDQNKRLKAKILGKEFSLYDNKIKREIKAATYANLKIEKTVKGYLKTVIIFDV